jgi:tRNA pseudouridine55 synthase
MLGILLVDKPPGITSHDAIYRARRALGIRKIGHTGTLDPLATGLLVMAVGPATRFLPFLNTEPKVYVGSAQLGITTTTQDSEGEVIEQRSIDGLEPTSVEVACSQFVGRIDQVPPMYSAVKIDGKRLYKLARQGIEVERKTRTVEVFGFDCTLREGGVLEFRVRCSSGTYVRTLMHDLGGLLGVGAHMTALRRTHSGGFNVIDAIAPESATPELLCSLEECLDPMPMMRLPEPVADRVRHGNEFPLAAQVPGDLLGLIDDQGLYAVAKRLSDGLWRPIRNLPYE